MSNTTVKVTFRTDRQAALIAGRVLGETVDIELDPSTFPRWPEFAEKLSIKGDTITCNHANLNVTDATPETALEAWQSVLDVKRAKEAELAASITKIEEFDTTTIAAETVRVFAGRDGTVHCPCTPTYSLGVIAEFKLVPYVSESHILSAVDVGWSMEVHGAAAKVAAKVRAERDRAIADYLRDNATALTEAARVKVEEFEAKKAAEAAEAEAARKAKFANRLETGRVVFEVDSYNDRRYGRPWGASVSLDGSKLSYNFAAATVTAARGAAGVVEIPCRPGDVIAQGQKDFRRPSDSDSTLYQMRDNGGLNTITKTEALNHLRALQPKTA